MCSPVKWPGEKGGGAGKEPAECQYQITWRPSAGVHGAVELAEALYKTGGNENLLQAN